MAAKAITETVSAIVKNQSGNGIDFDITGAFIEGIYDGEFYKLHFQNGETLADVQLKDFIYYFMDEIKRGDISLATFSNPKVGNKQQSM